MFETFKKDLKNRQAQFLYRKLDKVSGMDFVSNDYLNLSSHPRLQKALQAGLKEGISLSGRSSRLLAGTTELHEELDDKLQTLTSRQGILSFSSGYLANIGLIPALAKDRVIFSDQLNHASLIDGCSLSKRPCHIYPHRDLNVLENLLKQHPGQGLIVTESLFSMRGSFAQLEALSLLAHKYQALLYVDESHATGLFGDKFQGLTSKLKEQDNLITMHTCGKALGSLGAFAACSSLLKEYLVNNCRSFIYTTALPPLVLLSWKIILDILEQEPHRPLELRKKSLKFRQALAQHFSLEVTESPIVLLRMASSELACRKSSQLMSKGLAVKAVRPPTVPEEDTGLRIILKYSHSDEDISLLKQELLS